MGHHQKSKIEEQWGLSVVGDKRKTRELVHLLESIVPQCALVKKMLPVYVGVVFPVV